MAKRTILVIEDDDDIRQGIVDALLFHGCKTLEAADGETALQMAVTVDCDLVLLDLVLPKGDGFDILSSIRQTRPTLPVIILTALGREEDRVRGLRGGADDYVIKPFSVKELLARVEAVLRRSPERPLDISEVPVPGGVVDLVRREVRLDNRERTELSEREVELMRYLGQNRDRAISREEILSRVWRINPVGIRTRTIDMHIARLREKLGDDPANPGVILTVRGKGYMLANPEALP